MSQVDLHAVVSTVLTEDGITNVTQGTVACDHLRTLLSDLLKAADPEGYAEYRKLKHPACNGKGTLEDRRAATRFLFDRARDLLVPHYLPAKGR